MVWKSMANDGGGEGDGVVGFKILTEGPIFPSAPGLPGLPVRPYGKEGEEGEGVRIDQRCQRCCQIK